MDWTEKYNQKEIAASANRLIDEVIKAIHERNIFVYGDLSLQELALLLRFPIHVGTNIFIERVFRIYHQGKKEEQEIYPCVDYKPRHFKDTDESVVSYYYDYNINYLLLNDLSLIINGWQKAESKQAETKMPEPQKSILKDREYSWKYFIRKMKQTLCLWRIKLAKPPIVGEDSHWIRAFFPFSQLLKFDFIDAANRPDPNMRLLVRDCCQQVFMKEFKSIIEDVDHDRQIKLSERYADFIDHIIPLSVVEGFRSRFSYYTAFIKTWNIRQVHSFVGYYYNENLKVFAVLAKRKGAKIIGYAHGSSNAASSYKNTKNELAFLDYYITWGKEKSDWLIEGDPLKNLKMLNIGSVYLSSVPQWAKNKIDPDKLIIMYPSGPLMDFMCDLQEISPEKNRQHRLRVLEFLKELKKLYPKLKIIYKPFPGTYTNDPIKDFFAKELEEGIVQLTAQKPFELYDKVDLVIWDTISTGFAESIQSGVPTLVFQAVKEMELSTPVGQILDEKLRECGIVIYDIQSGLQSFNKLINNRSEFIKDCSQPIKIFRETLAYPVSKHTFVGLMNDALNREGAD